MARSARLGAWLGENLHVLNPVLYLYTKAMPKLITPLYNAFGVPGLVALPWVMLSLEKVAYDTFTAARGHDMYTEAQEIALALFSVYRFSSLNLGDTFGVEAVLLVAACQVSVRHVAFRRATSTIHLD